MDTSSYDAKIQTAGAEKDALRDEVEAACLKFIQICGRFFADDFQRRVESAITDQPTTTQNLGAEKLGELKRDLRALVGNMPDIVSERLNRPGLWEHRDPIPEESLGGPSPGFDLYFKAGKKAYEDLREIYSHLGPLLIKYGFASTGKDGSWENRPNALPRYKYGLTLSKEIEATLEKYKDLFEKFIKKLVEQRQLEFEKQKAIAKDLWDRA